MWYSIELHRKSLILLSYGGASLRSRCRLPLGSRYGSCRAGSSLPLLMQRVSTHTSSNVQLSAENESQEWEKEETIYSIAKKTDISPEEIENLFKHSVEARTVSNAQLRKYISKLSPGQHALALAAVRGSKAGGLQLNPLTHEVLLEKLIESGQLKASMTLHDELMRTHMTPTSKTYSLLMKMCLDRGLASSCEKLFDDMHKKGLRPSIDNYELLISAYADQNPPQWEKAIAIFDKITSQRYLQPSAKTYNSLMRVYLNMQPFDWRVVYNCYYELRHHDPRIPLEWESYELVKEALVRGRAGRIRRISTYLDAWVTITPLFTVMWVKGFLVYVVIFLIFKSTVGTLLNALLFSGESARTNAGNKAAL